MHKILTPTRFGNPVLRLKARTLASDEIQSEQIQSLIADMTYTLNAENYGVGIAAPQVGHSMAISVVGIKPTPTRPELKVFNATLINPVILETYGSTEPMWEGCLSCGSGKDLLYAQVPRYLSVKLRWTERDGSERVDILTGFAAHVVQHEVDHLNGILFVDKVENTQSYMMADEYRARIVGKKKN